MSHGVHICYIVFLALFVLFYTYTVVMGRASGVHSGSDFVAVLRGRVGE